MRYPTNHWFKCTVKHRMVKVAGEWHDLERKNQKIEVVFVQECSEDEALKSAVYSINRRGQEYVEGLAAYDQGEVGR